VGTQAATPKGTVHTAAGPPPAGPRGADPSLFLTSVSDMEDRLRKSLSESPVGRALVSLRGDVLASNADFAQVLGCDEAELVGRNMEDFSDPKDWFVQTALLHQAIAEGLDGYHLRKRYILPDRQVVWADLSVDIVRDRSGEPRYCVMVVATAEPPARAPAPNPSSEHRLVALVQNTQDLFALFDPDGIILYANPAANRALGRLNGAMARSTIFDHVHPDDRTCLRRALRRLVATSEPEAVQPIRLLGSGGDRRFVELVAGNGLDDPAIHGIVVDGRHITEQHDYLAQVETSLAAATQAVATALEFRDPHTAGHQRRVAALSGAIASALGIDPTETRGIGVAAGIHDIGKIVVPGELLNRPGTLSPLETELVREHVRKGFAIIEPVPFPWPVAQMILQHHERLDGSGYPFGATAEDILPGSRIIAVADAVEAMSSHRPYRPARGVPHALEEIEHHRGVLFDPDVVDACVALFKENRFNVRMWDAAAEHARNLASEAS